ncbi:MAG: GIY-YIG nuclease family protein [Ferruginibacter sp.]
MQWGGTVYMMCSINNRVIYTGVTSNLFWRVLEHKEKKNMNCFTAKYNCQKLVYFNSFPTIEEAISEEKRIKAGNRKQKEMLIDKMNPEWRDLWNDIKDW